MIWGYLIVAMGFAYIALILGTTIYVYRYGDGECRLAITTLLAGSALTFAAVYFEGSYFAPADPVLVGIEALVFAAFFIHGLYSRRYWPMSLPMLQGVNFAIHLAVVTVPGIVPDVYSWAQGLWAYPQMGIILMAAIYHRRTKVGKDLQHGKL